MEGITISEAFKMFHSTRHYPVNISGRIFKGNFLEIDPLNMTGVFNGKCDNLETTVKINLSPDEINI